MDDHADQQYAGGRRAALRVQDADVRIQAGDAGRAAPVPA